MAVLAISCGLLPCLFVSFVEVPLSLSNAVQAEEEMFVLDEAGFAALLGALVKQGFKPVGPVVRDGAVVYDTLSSVKDLPVGVADEQEGGQYRLTEGRADAWFGYVMGPTNWKKYLFPARHRLWKAEKAGDKFQYSEPEAEAPAYALIGVRPCELAAIHLQDKVFGYNEEPDPATGHFTDPVYAERRGKAFIVAANCGRAGKTCFCVSMGGDPGVKKGAGFDLAFTEIWQDEKHLFVFAAGSERGVRLMGKLPHRPAQASEIAAADAAVEKARGEMGREMVGDVENLLKRNLHHPQWDDVAERCLSCANCTLVCPTCFCSTVEETTDLKGDNAERWRAWDSCFSLDFSYIHGGAIRREPKARYRQWMTHKLSSWHDQFGSSGCVGCGRCITWCPVGIDITAEAKAIAENDGATASE